MILPIQLSVIYFLNVFSKLVCHIAVSQLFLITNVNFKTLKVRYFFENNYVTRIPILINHVYYKNLMKKNFENLSTWVKFKKKPTSRTGVSLRYSFQKCNTDKK